MTDAIRPDDQDKVVVLPGASSVDPEPRRPSPPGRLHGLFIAGMALSALMGIVAMFAFITIGWPGDTGRFVIVAFFVSVVVFLTCASAAVFTAARDTYVERNGNHLD